MDAIFQGKLYRDYLFQKQPPEVFYKKKLFLKISLYSQENTCVEVPFE